MLTPFSQLIETLFIPNTGGNVLAVITVCAKDVTVCGAPIVTMSGEKRIRGDEKCWLTIAWSTPNLSPEMFRTSHSDKHSIVLREHP
jgi:hypothetical protein